MFCGWVHSGHVTGRSNRENCVVLPHALGPCGSRPVKGALSLTTSWKAADCTAKLQLLTPDLYLCALSHLLAGGARTGKDTQSPIHILWATTHKHTDMWSHAPWNAAERCFICLFHFFSLFLARFSCHVWFDEGGRSWGYRVKRAIIHFHYDTITSNTTINFYVCLGHGLLLQISSNQNLINNLSQWGLVD